jgi:hypothetical protein
MLKRLPLITAGLLAAVAVVLPAGAQAAPGTSCQVTGTMLEGDFTAVQGDNWNGAPVNGFPGTTEVQTFTHPIYLTGGISGTGFDQERAWFNARTFDFTSHDKVTFDSSTGYGPATVTCPDGTSRSGGIEVNFLATGNYIANSFDAHFQIVGSSGGLNGTTGSGTMTGEPGVPGGNGTYTASVHLR